MKKIIKKFNNLFKKTIFKVEIKTNNNFKISIFNKCLVTFIALLFVYLFYLLIPLLYDKTRVKIDIENKLLKEFKINLSTSADISYHILPAPHFLIKNSIIFIDDSEKKKSIAEIKNFKAFFSQKNFFNQKKINLKNIVITDANFLLSRNDFNLISEFKNKKFSNKKIKINNSNIFIKNNLDETLSIIKINKASLFFDDKKLLNFSSLKGEVFNIPFILDVNNYINTQQYEKINFISKALKLNIFNESTKKKDKIITGENTISFLNSTINTKYSIKKKLIIFKSGNSKLDNSKVNYGGKLSTNPFDLDLNIHLDNKKISSLFNINSILIEFIKSGLLFNDNISVNSSIIINSNAKNEIFQNAKINFHIINGKIDFNKTKFVNDNIGTLQLSNSDLFIKDNKLMFKGDLLIEIKNSYNLFSFLNTSSKSRKNFKTIFINLNYDFLSNQIKFNNIKVDNKNVSSPILSIIDEFNDNNSNNFNKSRRIMNKIFKIYAG